MSKRAANNDEEMGGISLKQGGRPVEAMDEDEEGQFEDDFEDEFESEDEIMEAGVDGRPDAEREAEEAEGGQRVSIAGVSTDRGQIRWKSTDKRLSLGATN